MIAHGLPIYVALEPVNMRLGSERLGALVRDRMRAEPRSRALFVYSAGDAHRGASLIVWAIAEGRKLARQVDAALCQGRSTVPARGQDLPFPA